MIIVTRNTRDYGPYDEQTVAAFVREGRLLLRDKARDAETGREGTIEELLESKGIKAEVSKRLTSTI